MQLRLQNVTSNQIHVGKLAKKVSKVGQSDLQFNDPLKFPGRKR